MCHIRQFSVVVWDEVLWPSSVRAAHFLLSRIRTLYHWRGLGERDFPQVMTHLARWLCHGAQQTQTYPLHVISCFAVSCLSVCACNEADLLLCHFTI